MLSGGSATSGHSAITLTSGKRSVDRKGGARIDDGHVIAEQLAIGASAWLMCTAPVMTSRGGGTCTVRNTLALRRLLHAALARAQALLEQLAQRIARDVRRLDEPLLAARPDR